jgi:hypothetical protein
MQTRLQGAASRFHVLPAKVAVAVAVAVTVLQCSLRIQVVCPAVIPHTVEKSLFLISKLSIVALMIRRQAL